MGSTQPPEDNLTGRVVGVSSTNQEVVGLSPVIRTISKVY